MSIDWFDESTQDSLLSTELPDAVPYVPYAQKDVRYLRDGVVSLTTTEAHVMVDLGRHTCVQSRSALLDRLDKVLPFVLGHTTDQDWLLCDEEVPPTQ